jgi:Xaa-Pro dipeptidase
MRMRINEFNPDLERLKLLVETNVDRLNSLMVEKSIDALFVITNDNWRYLTGLPVHHSVAYFTVNAAVLMKGAKLPLLLPLDFFASRIRTVAPWYSVVAELPFHGTPEPIQPTGANKWPAIIAGVLKDLGLAKATIAIDAGTPWFLLEQIKAVLKTARFVDASPLLTEARIIKNQYEQKSIAEACRIADCAIEAALDFSNEGVAESQIAGVVEAVFRKEGAEYATMMPSVFSGEHPLLGYLCSSDRRVHAGELVRLDIACTVDGYCCCIARTGFVGAPDNSLLKAYDVLRHALQAGIDAVSPGKTNTHVHEVMHHILQHESGGTHGLDWYGGHGIGLGLHEQPLIGRSNYVEEITLRSGMTFALEPSILIPGKGWLGLEDNVAVTQTSVEILSHARFNLSTAGRAMAGTRY